MVFSLLSHKKIQKFIEIQSESGRINLFKFDSILNNKNYKIHTYSNTHTLVYLTLSVMVTNVFQNISSENDSNNL